MATGSMDNNEIGNNSWRTSHVSVVEEWMPILVLYSHEQFGYEVPQDPQQFDT
jgi:hypothetical protein